MTRLDPETYRRHIREESQRFRDALAGCDPQAPVPSCPEWVADDLLWHLGQVQHWWTWVIRNRPADPHTDGYAEPERPGDHDGLLAFYDEQCADLVDALDGVDPAEEAYTWNAADRTVGFTLRRQAHEALIHRVDAELAAGTSSPVDAALAADGVDEVLDVMYGGCPPWGEFSPLPHCLRIDLTDTGDSVWVQLGRFSGTDPEGTHHDEDDLHVVPDPGVEPDAVISGTAEQLDLRLWRRADGADIHLAGDLRIVDKFREITHQAIT